MVRVLLGWARAATLAAVLQAGQAAADQVDLELVLAIDISGSVDVDEFVLQRSGYAAALLDPEVVAAIEALPGGLALSALIWSGRRQQAVVIDWQQIESAADAARAAAEMARIDRSLLGETALGEALAFALRQLERSPFEARRRTIDVSGDGKTNTGPEPDRLRDLAILQDITINALAVIDEQDDLVGYYERHLIGGPGAFVMSVDDFADFAAAIREKLLLEIRGGPIARSPDRAPGARITAAGRPRAAR
ncbi:MAG: DUF1194 domain-containing protein [Geminicoccaceae bacterium]|nr:DUF1194 domain-containing protein [Geminicoccaceae bacterium]